METTQISPVYAGILFILSKLTHTAEKKNQKHIKLWLRFHPVTPTCPDVAWKVQEHTKVKTTSTGDTNIFPSSTNSDDNPQMCHEVEQL